MINQKKSKTPAKKRSHLWAIGIITLVLLIAVIIIVVAISGQKPDNQGTATGNFNTIAPTRPIKVENVEDVELDLGKNLVITDIGSYTGMFMEDGSDEIVSRVLMIVVKNTGSATVQYGEVILTDGTTTANFKVTTLPPGESVVLLEQSKMSYADGKELTQASVGSVATFAKEPGMCQDKVKIQALNGVLNITNISGQDITGDIVIYYKNAASDMLYGGITYRVTITGGLKADEVRQITAGHFTTSGSRIMFVTCG